MATPRIAAGALFTDDQGHVMLVRPTYKQHWDIPGGYVEPGESPYAACLREVHEELSISPTIEPQPLVVDWAPSENEGDKLLFVFSGAILPHDFAEIRFADGELAEYTFVAQSRLEQYVPARLDRRLKTALAARSRSSTLYAEHGVEVTLPPRTP